MSIDVNYLHLLLVEDNADDAELLRKAIDEEVRGEWQVRHVSTLSQALETLCREKDLFDVVVLDLELPDAAGIAVVEKVRAQAPDLPLLVLTGRSNQELAVQALREGAQDCLLKSNLWGEYIYSAITSAVERNRLRRELVEMNQALWGDDPEHIGVAVDALEQVAAHLVRIEQLNDALERGGDENDATHIRLEVKQLIGDARRIIENSINAAK